MSDTDDVQLNLKWDNFSSHLALSFDSCYESQQFVDVSLVCKDGDVIKGHKIILANTSKFFRRLLTENDHPHPMIVLHNIDAEDLRSLMTFMYCGEVQVFQNDLKKLLEIADTLEITGLQQVQESDNPGANFGGKNFVGLNNINGDQTENLNSNTYYDIIAEHSSKPASDLLKYVSSLGKKSSLENPLAHNFENSSKKLQDMARKFEKCSGGMGSWSLLQQVQNSNATKEKGAANDCGRKELRSLPDDGEPAQRLELESSSRKLQEMAKLLENMSRINTLSEVCKDASESQKRLLESDEIIAEPPSKKSNFSLGVLNTSENELAGQAIVEREMAPGRSVEREQFLQNCNVFIKDEVEVATECSTTPDVDLENSTKNDGGHSGPGAMAVELIKAVAKKKDTRLIYSAIRELTFEVQRQSDEIQELRNCLQSRGFLKIHTITVKSFAEDYGLSLQLQTIDEFKEFDKRLKDNGDFCSKFISTLEHLLEKEIQKSITAILKSYVSRELAICFTAIRRSSDKMIFKGTKFNDCLFSLICQYHRGDKNESLTEKEYYQALSSCLSNAKDWHGFRSARRQQGAAAFRRSGNGSRDDAGIASGFSAKVDETSCQDDGNNEQG